jgi:hypothetical protein
MNAYRIHSTVMPDGSIVLKGLPFSVGKSVEVIILEDSSVSEEVSHAADEPWKSLQGSVTHYEDPFEPAIPLSDWDVLQ